MRIFFDGCFKVIVCLFQYLDKLELFSYFLFDCLILSTGHTFLFLCMLSNFELYPGHCECYVLKYTDSVILLTRVFV